MHFFELSMKHSAESLKGLSRMQYDIFSKGSRITHTILCAACLMVGVVFFPAWWAILFLVYGGYLSIGSYNYADYKARKIVKHLEDSGIDYPASRFVFEKNALHIFSLPENIEQDEALLYSKILKLGEDAENFYIFPNQYGGYVIPKSELVGLEMSFKEFMEKKTGMGFYAKRSPLAQLMDRTRRKSNEPYHL